MSDRVRGLAQAQSLFNQLPDGARTELGDTLADIGLIELAAEKRDVARRTGALANALTIQLLLARLRVRIGLIGVKGKGAPWYGRLVEFGRRASTVFVERRKPGEFGLRGGRKRAESIAARYSLKVAPMAPRPFIYRGRPDVDNQVAARLAQFWSRAFADAGAA